MMERRGEDGVGEPTQLCKDLITAQVSTTWTRSSGMKRCCDIRLPFKRKRQHSFATSSSQEEKVAPVLLRNRSCSQQHGARWFGAFQVFFSWCTEAPSRTFPPVAPHSKNSVGLSRPQSEPDMLIASGFRVRTPNSTQQTKLQSLTAGQISLIQTRGLTLYVYPDWPNSRVLIGGPVQYQAYQQYRLSRHLPAENPPQVYRGPSSFDWRKWYSEGG